MSEHRSKCCGARVKTIKTTAFIVARGIEEEGEFFICNKCDCDFGYDGIVEEEEEE